MGTMDMTVDDASNGVEKKKKKKKKKAAEGDESVLRPKPTAKPIRRNTAKRTQHWISRRWKKLTPRRPRNRRKRRRMLNNISILFCNFFFFGVSQENDSFTFCTDLLP